MAEIKADEVEEAMEPRCGFDVCVPTPGLTPMQRCCADSKMLPKLCMPNFLGPFAQCFPALLKQEDPPFLGKDAKPGFIVTMLMGYQHFLAMLVGVITPPRLLANEGCLLGRDADLCKITPYLICSALLASGILSIFQIMRIRIGGGFYFGTGLLSVMGTSFTFLPIGQAMIKESTIGNSEFTPLEMYGKFLGTCMVACWVEVILSFLPPKFIKKLCPPVVSGTVVFCIGAALTKTGFLYWGGGVFCANNVWSRGMEAVTIGNRFTAGPQSCMADNGGERGNPPGGDIVAGRAPPGFQGVDEPFGDLTFVGYGFIAVMIFCFIACFGSPFMRSCNIAISFILTYIISSFAEFQDVVMGGVTYKQRLVTNMFYELTAKETPISFFWNGIVDAPSFKLGFSPEYFVPILICFFISTAESIGDITATAGASKEPTTGKSIYKRIQGGLLADGINSFLACCFLTPPNTTFSQNTGVVSMTHCGSRAAGFACCFWLILAGLWVPYGAALADCPLCVVGGIVTILFCSIMVSGIRILARAPNTMRNHVIMAVALGLGLGVSQVPHMLKGGGDAAFYGSVLEMNTGFWPLHYCCNPGTEVYYTSDFPVPGPFGSYFASSDLNMNPLPGGMVNTANGLHRGKYLMHPHNWVKSCEINPRAKSWRTAGLLLLNTPYCLGFLVALILNLILPELDGEAVMTEESGSEAVKDEGSARVDNAIDGKVVEGI